MGVLCHGDLTLVFLVACIRLFEAASRSNGPRFFALLGPSHRYVVDVTIGVPTRFVRGVKWVCWAGRCDQRGIECGGREASGVEGSTGGGPSLREIR